MNTKRDQKGKGGKDQRGGKGSPRALMFAGLVGGQAIIQRIVGEVD